MGVPGRMVGGKKRPAGMGELVERKARQATDVAVGQAPAVVKQRLGVGRLLRQTLASTNPIESCFSIVEKVVRNVKRWRAGDHALRWTATGLLEEIGKA